VIPIELSLVESLGRVHARPWADSVTGVKIDSRRIDEGDLFVAVGGGRDFVKHALAFGAAATLEPDDEHAALATLARAVRDRSRARVVAITGSFGKTTTKDVLAALCAPHARTVAAEASYNNELGVPLTVCRVEPDTEILVLELSMRGGGQIASLASFARPHIGVITNIGPAHLELLGSLERIAAAKAELLAFVEEAVLPADEPLLDPHVPDGMRVRRFAADDVVSFERGRGRFRVDGRILELELNMTMRHNAVNVLAALNVYAALGLPLDEVQAGAAHIEHSPWHGQELALAGGGTLIADCWNANPVSMRAALEHAVEVAAGRRLVAVLGGMAELGPGTEAYHREIGEAVAALGFAELVTVGELAEAYREGSNGVSAHRASSASDAVDVVRGVLQPGDVVLVKGSRSVGLELVAEKLGS
jgi:UDP-N-acetylmuramoyl-tripeptide--D-alanyl-D-alanine ligase